MFLFLFLSPQLQTAFYITVLQQCQRWKPQAERRDSCWEFSPASLSGEGGRRAGKVRSYKFGSGPLHSFPWQHRGQQHLQPLQKNWEQSLPWSRRFPAGC